MWVSCNVLNLWIWRIESRIKKNSEKCKQKLYLSSNCYLQFLIFKYLKEINLIFFLMSTAYQIQGNHWRYQKLARYWLQLAEKSLGIFNPDNPGWQIYRQGIHSALLIWVLGMQNLIFQRGDLGDPHLSWSSFYQENHDQWFGITTAVFSIEWEPLAISAK